MFGPADWPHAYTFRRPYPKFFILVACDETHGLHYHTRIVR